MSIWINAQSVGAFGERAVEVELLRRGWIPANVNATVKNAADFDIFAVKDDKMVLLRVRACAPDARRFQFGGFKPDKPVQLANFKKNDFTVLVAISSDRTKDEFYVMPSRVLREEIILRQKDYLAIPKKDGTKRKDTGHWALHLAKRKDGRQQGGYGLEEKWKKYANAWHLLDA
jgi:hypothetical protein